jgi:DNA-binding MarR family transcriptional regulator
MSPPTPSAGSRRPLAESVLSELRAVSTAQDRLRQYAAQRFRLNHTDLRALDYIGQAGIISPTELAAALGMSTGATSAVLDRLEAAGYATRQPDPVHRRRTQVRMSPRAAKLSAEIFAQIQRGTIEQAVAYPDEVLVAVAELLSAHRALLDRYVDAATVGEDGTAAT